MRIYALVSDEEVLYVGKTIRHLRDRKAKHNCPTANSTGSRNIPKDIAWDIMLLEEVPDDQGKEYERYYIDFLQPRYNISMPGGRVITEGEDDSKTKTRQQKYDLSEKGSLRQKRYRDNKKSEARLDE